MNSKYQDSDLGLNPVFLCSGEFYLQDNKIVMFVVFFS